MWKDSIRHSILHIVSNIACLLPAPAQEQDAQGHVVGHVEAVVHLPPGALVEEAADLENPEVSGATHHHGQSQQHHGQARLGVVVARLRDDHDRGMTV